MPDDETGSPRQSRGPRKNASRSGGKSFADDWPNVEPAAAPNATTEPSDPPARQRIARAMARAGLCSRRDAEAWILAGRVTVNGEILTSPARDVGPDDHVEVDGAPLPEAEKTRLFLFHKPRGLVTSDHDPEGRETVADHLREHWPAGPRVVTIGRLDINTEGLLLLTNDGGLARTLELPKTGWLRRYRVRANGETDQAKLDALADGITIEGVDYAGIEAKLDRVQGANCWLTMGLREGKNREIKRVLEHLGLEVNRLIRLSFGPFQLLDLEEGKVEEVRTRVLRDQLGAALAAEAGVDFGEAPAPAATPAPVERTATVVKRQVMTRKDAPQTGRRPTVEAMPRSDRPARAPSRTDRPEPTRGRDGARARDFASRATNPSEDRQPARPRRHVSTLRRDEGEAARTGPRRRIERSDTRDVNDRTVTVERKMTVRPARISPSAEGKRARIARSGGARKRFEGGSEGARDTQRVATGRTRPGKGQASAGGERARFQRRDDRAGGADRRGSGETRGSGEGRSPRREARSDAGTRQERPRFEGRGAAGAVGDSKPAYRDRPRGDADERSEGRARPDRARPASGARPPRRDAAPADRNAARRDAGTGGARSTGKSAGNKSFGSKSSGDKRPGGTRWSSSTGKPAGGRPTGGRPSGGKPSGGKPSGSRPAGNRPSGGRPPRGGSGRPKR